MMNKHLKHLQNNTQEPNTPPPSYPHVKTPPLHCCCCFASPTPCNNLLLQLLHTQLQPHARPPCQPQQPSQDAQQIHVPPNSSSLVCAQPPSLAYCPASPPTFVPSPLPSLSMSSSRINPSLHHLVPTANPRPHSLAATIAQPRLFFATQLQQQAAALATPKYQAPSTAPSSLNAAPTAPLRPLPSLPHRPSCSSPSLVQLLHIRSPVVSPASLITQQRMLSPMLAASYKHPSASNVPSPRPPSIAAPCAHAEPHIQPSQHPTTLTNNSYI